MEILINLLRNTVLVLSLYLLQLILLMLIVPIKVKLRRREKMIILYHIVLGTIIQASLIMEFQDSLVTSIIQIIGITEFGVVLSQFPRFSRNKLDKEYYVYSKTFNFFVTRILTGYKNDKRNLVSHSIENITLDETDMLLSEFLKEPITNLHMSMEPVIDIKVSRSLENTITGDIEFNMLELAEDWIAELYISSPSTGGLNNIQFTFRQFQDKEEMLNNKAVLEKIKDDLIRSSALEKKEDGSYYMDELSEIYIPYNKFR